jgi:hypothetical protein
MPRIPASGKARPRPMKPVACCWCFSSPTARCPLCRRWLCDRHASEHKHKGKKVEIR